MRAYETTYIIDPAIEEETVEQVVDGIKQQIESFGGQIGEIDIWGKRKLAYEAKKRTEGVYVVAKFQGNPGIANKLCHLFKINDKILRYIVVVDE